MKIVNSAVAKHCLLKQALYVVTIQYMSWLPYWKMKPANHCPSSHQAALSIMRNSNYSIIDELTNSKDRRRKKRIITGEQRRNTRIILARPGWTTSRRGQDSLWKSQSEWQRTGINGESTSMVWPTLGPRKAKEQNRTHHYVDIQVMWWWVISPF